MMVKRIACNFCLKSQDEVKLMIAGPNDIAICNECVELCVGIVSEYEEAEANNAKKAQEIVPTSENAAP